jgi:hypothetical protein
MSVRINKEKRIKLSHIILNAFANVVRTKGSESQNHGLKEGRYSIIIITTAEMKK